MFDPHGFSFNNLEHLQHIEEKGKQILLALRTNIEILSELESYFKSLFESDDFPACLKEECKRDTLRSRRRVLSIVGDLKLRQSTLELLLDLLADNTYHTVYRYNHRYNHIKKRERHKAQVYT